LLNQGMNANCASYPKVSGSLVFRVISKIYGFKNGLWIRLSGLTYPRSYQEYPHFPTKYKRAKFL